MALDLGLYSVMKTPPETKGALSLPITYQAALQVMAGGGEGVVIISFSLSIYELIGKMNKSSCDCSRNACEFDQCCWPESTHDHPLIAAILGILEEQVCRALMQPSLGVKFKPGWWK